MTLRTKAGVATLADLVRSTLRLRPDRIIVGEVRGAVAKRDPAFVEVAASHLKHRGWLAC